MCGDFSSIGPEWIPEIVLVYWPPRLCHLMENLQGNVVQLETFTFHQLTGTEITQQCGRTSFSWCSGKKILQATCELSLFNFVGPSRVQKSVRACAELEKSWRGERRIWRKDISEKLGHFSGLFKEETDGCVLKREILSSSLEWAWSVWKWHLCTILSFEFFNFTAKSSFFSHFLVKSSFLWFHQLCNNTHQAYF